MTAIKVGIAGLGRSGWSMHAMALEKLPDLFQVSAVSDLDSARTAEAKERFLCSSHESLESLVSSDCELVVIASPSPFHKEQTIRALNAGKHVIVEKPLAQSVEDVDAMILAAKQAQKLLTINQNYRYKKPYKKIAEILASGVLGELIEIKISIHQFSRRWDWQTLRENNGGILTNHGAHALDWLLLNFQDEDPEVFCHLVNTPLYAGDADSHAKVIIRPKDGPLIDLELTHCNTYPQDKYLVMGTQGSLKGDDTDIHWQYYLPENEPKLELDLSPTADRSYNSESLRFTQKQARLHEEPNDDLLLLYADLYKSIREGMPLVITAKSVRRQIKLFEACRQSAGWA